jgi:hypothetical protein
VLPLLLVIHLIPSRLVVNRRTQIRDYRNLPVHLIKGYLNLLADQIRDYHVLLA